MISVGVSSTELSCQTPGMRTTVEKERVIFSATFSSLLLSGLRLFLFHIAFSSRSDLNLEQATRKQNTTYNTKANLAPAFLKRQI